MLPREFRNWIIWWIGNELRKNREWEKKAIKEPKWKEEFIIIIYYSTSLCGWWCGCLWFCLGMWHHPCRGLFFHFVVWFIYSPNSPGRWAVLHSTISMSVSPTTEGVLVRVFSSMEVQGPHHLFNTRHLICWKLPRVFYFKMHLSLFFWPF